MKDTELLAKNEIFKAPSTILFRAIETKLLRRKIKRYLKQTPALDLGCGDGIIADFIFERMLEYGLDNNRLSVKDAERLGMYQKVFCVDASNIPLKNNTLKLVFSNCVLEHIPHIEKVFAEVNRVLAPGGYFIFTTPSHNLKRYSVFSYIKLGFLNSVYAKARDKKLEHYHCYSIAKWSSLLKKYGFSCRDSYYYLGKNETIFWDFLLIFYKAFQVVWILFPKFYGKLYEITIRKRILAMLAKAKPLTSGGAAVCVIAQKDGWKKKIS
ncbi:MAG: class I SAM-dependent methyltransferase [Patescibacteria group bacterium]|jgi:SAM-dependent methyltransferase